MSFSKPLLFFFLSFFSFVSSSRFLCLQKTIATTTLFTVCSRGFCRLLRRKTDRNRHGRPQFRSSRGLSRFLRQKTDPNPPWTTILSVLTASPPDWRFSQVSGDRCGGEEVHEVKTSVDCVVNYGRDRSSSSCVFEKSLEIGRSQSFSSRLKLLILSVKQLLLPTGGERYEESVTRVEESVTRCL
ncbi:hypothetical protein YC2023_062323 [Brassica napus]